jgi:hypothetical protein
MPGGGHEPVVWFLPTSNRVLLGPSRADASLRCSQWRALEAASFSMNRVCSNVRGNPSRLHELRFPLPLV